MYSASNLSSALTSAGCNAAILSRSLEASLRSDLLKKVLICPHRFPCWVVPTHGALSLGLTSRSSRGSHMVAIVIDGIKTGELE